LARGHDDPEAILCAGPASFNDRAARTGGAAAAPQADAPPADVPPALRVTRPVVLVGLMGAGKTCVGRLLARRLGLGFVDSDEEVVKASACSIADIFRLYGEAAFREGERKVMRRLLGAGPVVLASGGGAFMDPETRDMIREGATSVWLRASLDTLVARTAGRPGRPLLEGRDPRAVLESLIAERYPVYARADVVVDTANDAKDAVAERIVRALAAAADAGRGTGRGAEHELVL
jgi:shikimate kinase